MSKVFIFINIYDVNLVAFTNFPTTTLIKFFKENIISELGLNDIN